MCDPLIEVSSLEQAKRIIIMKRFNGLTDGISSRILSANRSELLPSLASLSRQAQTERSEDRKTALHGRLDELLVRNTSRRQLAI